MRIQRLGWASLVLVILAAACTGPVPTLPSPTRHYAAEGIGLDYPASWAINDAGWPTTGFGSDWAVMGTMPWGDCPRSEINCHYQQRLAPGEVQIEVGLSNLQSYDVCTFGATRPDLAGRGAGASLATGSLTRVDGRPAVTTVWAPGPDDYYLADEYRDWLIAVPEGLKSVYTIRAMYRGPGLDGLRAEVDRLIASIRLGPADLVTVGPAPSDCPAPFPSPDYGHRTPRTPAPGQTRNP